MRLRVFALWGPLLAALVLAAGAPADDDEGGPGPKPKIYKWIDENGIAHYTLDRERIPDSLRKRAQGLGSPDAALESRALEARAPEDAFDLWAVRNRAARLSERWDEGGFGASSRPLTPEERAALEAARADLDGRIAELEAIIASDENLLKEMIADRSGLGPLDRADDPEFRSVATRLPKRLAELGELRRQRAQLESQ